MIRFLNNSIFILAVFISAPFYLHSQEIVTGTSNTIKVENGSYVDNIQQSWIVNTGINDKAIKLSFKVDLEFEFDYLTIYNVDSNNNPSSIIASYTGFESGVITTTIPNGKVFIEFSTDGSVCYDFGYKGFSVSYTVDQTFTITDNSTILGNSFVNGSMAIGMQDYFQKFNLNGNAYINGSMGIGNPYPTEKLDVQGNIKVNGNMTVNSKLSVPSTTVSNSIMGKLGIGTSTPGAKLEVKGNTAVFSDFANYNGTTVNNTLPNGKNPTLNITENTSGTMNVGIGGQVTYRGGLSFGIGGPGIYSVNPNSAGSIDYYGELRFHTTYWNGSGFNNSDRMVIKMDGNVGIGTINPQYLLDVKGIIRATEVRIESIDKFADFVFEKNYKLRPLSQVHSFIQENGHLPEIPSAAEVKENGMSLVEMQVKLLQKVEELTLYIIEQQKRIELLENK